MHHKGKKETASIKRLIDKGLKKLNAFLPKGVQIMTDLLVSFLLLYSLIHSFIYLFIYLFGEDIFKNPFTLNFSKLCRYPFVAS